MLARAAPVYNWPRHGHEEQEHHRDRHAGLAVGAGAQLGDGQARVQSPGDRREGRRPARGILGLQLAQGGVEFVDLATRRGAERFEIPAVAGIVL